jgi:hypothetical protein
VIIAARTGKIVCEWLTKPHTPRLHKGVLWRLNFGTGELGVVTEIDLPPSGWSKIYVILDTE